ncbi:MAG: deoxyribodipyrimidine photolyase [Pedobacter sp.]|nr:deoxyribodipyrimidine photolyase [Pedobacter sp.]
MKSKKILVWFRNDLRLHDNEMLVEAITKSESILPVYFFDPRHFDAAQVAKAGFARAKFLVESVVALRMAFQKMGGDILIVNGMPENHITDLVERFEIGEVYHHREVAPAETQVSANVEDMLWKSQVNLRHFIGHTLYNKEDLPFPIKDIPDIFAQFKKKTERDAIVKPCIESPEHIDFVEVGDWGSIPTAADLFLDKDLCDYTGMKNCAGGEEAGLKQLSSLLAQGSAIYLKPATKQSDRHGYNSQLSAWLSLGCLSPRKVFWAVKHAEEQFGSNPNFSHLTLGLLWRDYYRFMFKKHGAEYLAESVLRPELDAQSDEDLMFENWKSGNTGHSLIDAHMRDLNQTGFLSHSARILVATFLVHVLKVNWMKGAVYFEEKLIDYTTASNWGNWSCIASGSRDLKTKHTFDVNKQLKVLESTL